MFAVNVFPAFNYFLALLFHSARPNRAFDVVSLIDNLQRNIPQSQEWNMLILILVIQSFFKSRTKLRGQVKRRSISCLNGWEKVISQSLVYRLSACSQDLPECVKNLGQFLLLGTTQLTITPWHVWIHCFSCHYSWIGCCSNLIWCKPYFKIYITTRNNAQGRVEGTIIWLLRWVLNFLQSTFINQASSDPGP